MFGESEEKKPEHPWASQRAEKAIEWVIVFGLLCVVVVGVIWFGQAVLL